MQYRHSLWASVFVSMVLAGCAGAQNREAAVADARAAEAHSCVGISDPVHRAHPIFQPELVSQVTPLYREERHGRATFTRVRGAEIHVRATPSVTAQWLQRSLECHIARRELGRVSHNDVPNDPVYLPAGPASVHVREARDGFVVVLEGRDAAHAREVLSRARALVTPTSAGYAEQRPGSL